MKHVVNYGMDPGMVALGLGTGRMPDNYAYLPGSSRVQTIPHALLQELGFVEVQGASILRPGNLNAAAFHEPYSAREIAVLKDMGLDTTRWERGPDACPVVYIEAVPEMRYDDNRRVERAVSDAQIAAVVIEIMEDHAPGWSQLRYRDTDQMDVPVGEFFRTGLGFSHRPLVGEADIIVSYGVRPGEQDADLEDAYRRFRNMELAFSRGYISGDGSGMVGGTNLALAWVMGLHTKEGGKWPTNPFLHTSPGTSAKTSRSGFERRLSDTFDFLDSLARKSHNFERPNQAHPGNGQ